MSPDWIIGALALFTIGGVLVLTFLHFGVYLKDPKNLDAFKRVATDRESAATSVSSQGTAGRTLRQRLDQAPSIDDGLGGREVRALGLWDVMFDTQWSRWRATLQGRTPS